MEYDFINRIILQPKINPIVGFILQKDVYTTNLLYANNQFPVTSLKKTLPFRSISGRKAKNPSSSLTVYRQNGVLSDNSEDEEVFYMRNTFKPKKLNNKHLKFPLPKIAPIPLTNSILREDICKQDVKIQYLEDDLNITSKFGKKIIYNLKENNHSYYNNHYIVKGKIRLPLRDKKVESELKYHYIKNPRMKKYNSELIHNKRIKRTFNKYDLNIIRNVKNILPIRQAISQINSELKIFKNEDKERRKAFYKNEFFTTQVHTSSNNESSTNKNKSSSDVH